MSIWPSSIRERPDQLLVVIRSILQKERPARPGLRRKREREDGDEEKRSLARLPARSPASSMWVRRSSNPVELLFILISFCSKFQRVHRCRRRRLLRELRVGRQRWQRLSGDWLLASFLPTAATVFHTDGHQAKFSCCPFLRSLACSSSVVSPRTLRSPPPRTAPNFHEQSHSLPDPLLDSNPPESTVPPSVQAFVYHERGRESSKSKTALLKECSPPSFAACVPACLPASMACA